MTEVKKILDGYHSVTPALIVQNGLKAIEYYTKVFGANQRACIQLWIGNSHLRQVLGIWPLSVIHPVSLNGA